ncbi:MAG: hypothetical protein IKF16_05680, partial [Lachnospiraceae bacterium]|nr:hypothetical protein [Lachnospiraceae bacterium]
QERGRILNRRACIPRIEPKQTRCRKRRAEAEETIHKPMAQDFSPLHVLSGNSMPQKLQSK